MSIEERSDAELPELHLSKEGPRCGKFVGKDGDRDLYCDLPEGHAETACSAPVRDADL
jgi:hypothetical protein